MRANLTAALALTLCIGFGQAALANKLDDAQSAFAEARDAEALALYSEVLADPATAPEAQATARFGRGEVLALNNKHDEAIADFTAALALPQAPNERAMTYFSRAESLSRRNRLDEAVKDYSESYNLSPDQVGVLSARGAAYQRLGKDDLALADYEAELKKRPTYYRALSSRAALLKQPLPPNPEEGRR